jgi:hypothetical protein
MNLRLAASALLLCLALGHASGQDASSLSTGKSLSDPGTGITYVLEDDQHHVLALDKKNHVIWIRDMAMPKDPKSLAYPGGKIISFNLLEPDAKRYRTYGRPDEFIEVGFNTTVFGLIRKKDGSFIFLGQD